MKFAKQKGRRLHMQQTWLQDILLTHLFRSAAYPHPQSVSVRAQVFS